MPIQSNASYVPSQITSSTVIKVGSGVLGRIFVTAASATPVISVYDSATAQTATGKIVDVFTPTAASNYSIDAAFSNGCYVVISGTVSCTILYV